jgi:hypothetical protein
VAEIKPGSRQDCVQLPQVLEKLLMFGVWLTELQLIIANRLDQTS